MGLAHASLSKRLSPRQSDVIQSYVREAAARERLEASFILAIIRVESAFNYRAVSHAGAIGLMQIMPKTAKELGALEALDRSNPRANIMAGSRLIRRLINRYRGNIKLALAAYNAGPSAVKRYGGIPPYRETQNYVKKVLREWRRQRTLSLLALFPPNNKSNKGRASNKK